MYDVVGEMHWNGCRVCEFGNLKEGGCKKGIPKQFHNFKFKSDKSDDIVCRYFQMRAQR